MVPFLVTAPSHHFAAFPLIVIILNQTRVAWNCFQCRRCVVIVPPPLAQRLDVPKQQYHPIHPIVLVPVDSVDALFPNQTCPAIVPRSPLQRVH